MSSRYPRNKLENGYSVQPGLFGLNPDRTRPSLTETIAEIVAAHRAGKTTPAQSVARTFQRIRALDDAAIFISLRDEKEAIAEAEKLGGRDGSKHQLYGVPVAVKDNIDVAGLPTTAACPAYSYLATRDAT